MYSQIDLRMTKGQLLGGIGNMSDCRYMADSRAKGCEFDPGQVPYFGWGQSWKDFLIGHSPPFHWLKEELLSVTSQSKICVQSIGKLLTQACLGKKRG